jgi:hypothetical protein
MKDIIPSDSRYLPIVQQKSCCVPACISMIMYRHKLPLISQELLGYNLGLTIDGQYRKLFWNPRVGKRPPSGYGTKMYDEQFNPNRVFPKLGIPLKTIFHPINEFTLKGLNGFLRKAEKGNRDILVAFDHGVLLNEKKKFGSGHVCVFDRLNSGSKIRLVDPSPSQPKWRIVSLRKLKTAMDRHTKEGGGLWEFSVIKK